MCSSDLVWSAPVTERAKLYPAPIVAPSGERVGRAVAPAHKYASHSAVPMSRSRLPLCLLLGLPLLAACGQDVRPAARSQAGLAGAPASPGGVQAEYDAGGKLVKIAYDRNKDGKPDAWGYMDGSRVVRVEVDENGDGTVDRWEYHTTAGPDAAPRADGVDPTLERIERATKLDGTVTRKEFFERGELVRVEEDTDGDGRVDKWETYAKGALVRMELDTAGRGKADRRLVYTADGSFDHIEADPDGTGTFRTLQP